MLAKKGKEGGAGGVLDLVVLVGILQICVRTGSRQS